MSDETKCSCQRCGEHIEFPMVMAGQNVACPHCGRETTLTLPTVRKATPPPAMASAEKPKDKKHEQQQVTKIMMIVIAIAAIIIAILIYNWRVNSLTRALSGY